MIDHLTVTVTDLKKTCEFYDRVFAPLGYRQLMTFEEFVGYGDRKPWFWVKRGDTPSRPMHIAFAAKTPEQVDAFHKAALEAGARDDGAPGPRSHYHPNYYGAFVVDPNGHPIEAVCHSWQSPK